MTGAVPSSVEQLPATLLLWDVDHTLIENGGISREAYSQAFELLTGHCPLVQPITDGRTDFQIMHTLMEVNGIDPAPYAADGQVEAALINSLSSKAPELAKRGHVLGGVTDAVTLLSNAPNVVQSVLTGNIAPNAQVKLAAFDLPRFFDLDVGGFGSDHIVRARLVQVVRDRVAVKYGRHFDENSTILVGDTPLDVAAARDGGARIVAVATGSYSVRQLAESGADATLENLHDLDAFLSALVTVRALRR